MRHTNELLAASGMVGRASRTRPPASRRRPRSRRRTVSVGGNLAQDAPVGAHVDREHRRLQQRRQRRSRSSSSSRAPPTAGRCRRRATAQSIGAAARRSRSTRAASARAATSRSRSSDLDDLDGTSGTWPPAGITLDDRRAERSEPARDGSGRVERPPCSNRTAATARASAASSPASRSPPTDRNSSDRRPRRSAGVGDGGASTGPVIHAGARTTHSIYAFSTSQSSAIPRGGSHMLRSMFAAVSGLQAHQTFMDVVGNNIANVNTTGFKAGTVEFEDLLSQTMNGAGAPASAIAGGTNPAQVGLGVRLAGIGTNFSQGAAQLTGRSTDFAIQGDGFFVVDQGGVQAYTRNGSFSLDGLGQLVTADGGLVQGWQADPNGNVNTNASTGPVKIPVGQTISPVTTATSTSAATCRPTRRRARRSTCRSTCTTASARRSRCAWSSRRSPTRPGSVELDRHDLRLRATTSIAGPTAVTVRHSTATLTSGEHHAHAGAAEHDRGHVGHVGGGRHGARLRHRDRRRPPHRRGDAQQRRRVVAGRFARSVRS